MTPSPSLCAFNNQLEAHAQDFAKARGEYEARDRGEDDDDDDLYTRAQTALTAALESTCTLGRKAAAEGSGLDAQELLTFLKSASDFECELIDYAYESDAYDADALFDFVPPFCGNVVQNEEMGLGLGYGAAASFNELLRCLKGPDAQPVKQEEVFLKLLGKAGLPYDPAKKPSPHTSPLARHRENRPAIDAAVSSLFRTIAEARCEIYSVRIPMPTTMAASLSVLASLGCTGWKNREPYVEVYKLDHGENLVSLGYADPGLEDTIHTVAVDDARRLVFVADDSRIKSFMWDTDDPTRELLPVHTMDSGTSHNPIALVDGGARLLRTSKKELLVWDVDRAPTHGKDGTKIVGKKMKMSSFDTMRDDPEENIELSRGSKPSRTLSLDALFSDITAWTPHPSQPSYMICGTEQSRCIQLNVETGHAAAYWLGHGAKVSSIETSAADPQVFLTAAMDGVTRLYDMRQPTPVLAVFTRTEHTYSSTLAYVDGHPFIFVGGTQSEQVDCWDVRARAPLYELSTGNTSVSSLAWDAPRNTLYAQAECEYVDRHGYHHDYRSYRAPKRERAAMRGMDGDEDNDYGDDDEEEDEWERCWPSSAFHDERSFGYGYDSGEHSLFRYVFKADADIKKVPEYGQATVDSGYGHW
ncbi:hypothetical protein BOTBODRAFT_28528 [Botryobasidium botryosum FD-172 SS1]|uniref:Uncharacterized protein n=1 Tax=Botryobasidium botryosum (strain FD-172 SS1) TaxID=930990 RepID=A0A067MTV7_BOTB1|nr:hypothetical protein BOTBODRAFT_28528 [Botryobasidium botryosum FD-172 SS1]